MEQQLYTMFIEKTKTYNKLTKVIITQHVENLKRLDENGQVEFCGVFKGYPGVAGMIILRAQSREEAENICKSEPLVMGGYATYRLCALLAANKDNNYLL